MVCPKCYSFRPPSEKFCKEDGAQLVEFDCDCGQALTVTQKYCERCGAPSPIFQNRGDSIAALEHLVESRKSQAGYTFAFALLPMATLLFIVLLLGWVLGGAR